LAVFDYFSEILHRNYVQEKICKPSEKICMASKNGISSFPLKNICENTPEIP